MERIPRPVLLDGFRGELSQPQIPFQCRLLGLRLDGNDLQAVLEPEKGCVGIAAEGGCLRLLENGRGSWAAGGIGAGHIITLQVCSFTLAKGQPTKKPSYRQTHVWIESVQWKGLDPKALAIETAG
ncbi:hypothetical protein D3C76_1457440 [compost metagenome]